MTSKIVTNSINTKSWWGLEALILFLLILNSKTPWSNWTWIRTFRGSDKSKEEGLLSFSFKFLTNVFPDKSISPIFVCLVKFFSFKKLTSKPNSSPRFDSVFNKSTTGFKSETQEFADADPRGRFPANVMHDGLDESWAKYFYCPKTSKSERHNSALKNTHPTVKPVELMKYLCRLVTPKDGTVLDPFMGSGSTGMAAKDEGFDFIGIEKEREYYEIAEARIKKTAPLMDFFS